MGRRRAAASPPGDRALPIARSAQARGRRASIAGLSAVTTRADVSIFVPWRRGRKQATREADDRGKLGQTVANDRGGARLGAWIPIGCVILQSRKCNYFVFEEQAADLRVLPGHPEPAVSWHSGFRRGAHARHKTTPVHLAARWYGSDVAARGARAAGGEAAHDRVSGRNHARGSDSVDYCFCAAIARTRLDGGSQRRDRVSLGGGASERYTEIPAEFVRLKVDVVFTHGTPATILAKQSRVSRGRAAM